MNGHKRSAGYTIIEVMIVLAVSGLMFVIAAGFINGKQAKTAFTQGTNEMVSQMQTNITQVSDGQFTDIGFSCSAGGGSLNVDGTVTGSTQGTKNQCVFLGKFIHVRVNGDPNLYEILQVAGANDPTATTYTAAKATALTDANGGSVQSLTLTTHLRSPQSLDITKIVAVDTAGVSHDVYGIGFMQDLSQKNAGNIILVYAPTLNSLALNTEADAANAIHNGMVQATAGAICMTDGSRYAEIQFGDSTATANQLSVNRKVVSSFGGGSGLC